MAAVSLRGVSSAPRAEGFALREVDLDVPDGVVCAVIGPSGSGKSTLLRVIAGLEPVKDGEVRFGDVDATRWPPAQRDLGYCPQQHPLYPHLNVGDNIGFALKLRKMSRTDRERRVRAEARAAGVDRLLARMPRTLSGGERRAAGIARSLVRLPSAFLLDEPLSGTDAHQRARLRGELAEVFGSLEVPVLLATNDQLEALTLGDHLAVLREGRIVQQGPAQEVHDRPDTDFVATFVGDPAMNLVPAVLEAGRRTTYADISHQAVPLPRVPPPLRSRLDGQPVLLGVRPQHVRLGGAEAPLAATIVRVETLGAVRMVHASLAHADARMIVRVTGPGRLARGQPVRLEPDPRHTHLYDPVNGQALWHAADA